MIGIEKHLEKFKDYFGHSPKIGDKILVAGKLYLYKGFVSGVIDESNRIALSNFNPKGYKESMEPTLTVPGRTLFKSLNKGVS